MRSVLIAVLCLVGSSGSLVAQNRMLDFELVNRTGLTIMELYVTPSNAEEWGEDVLGKDVLNHNESVDIEFSRRERDCIWDLRIVDEDDDAVEWERLDLCKANQITLLYEGKRPTAIIK